MSVIYGNPITLGGGSAAPAIFGDGSDGVGLFTSNTTWLADTEDTGMIVKNFESLTISEGVTVSAGNRNCGMIVRVKGDCIIHGTLANKMSCKTLLDSDGVDFSMWPTTLLTGTGGNGGNGGPGVGGESTNGSGGSGMTGRMYGGGWSGGGGSGCSGNYAGCTRGAAGGSVSNITTAVGEVFVGGARTTGSVNGNAGSYGGGGSGGNKGSSGYGGAGGSGAGGDGEKGSYNGGGGGGAGNYGGGVIILFVGGELTITGSIDCSGGKGGNYGSQGGQATGYGGSGGGGGGGRIFVCHKGAISNTGTLNVNGGSAGTGLNATGTGTAGTIGTTAVKTYEQYMEEDVA